MATPSRFPFDAQNPIAYQWPRIRTAMQMGSQNVAVSGKEYRINYWPWAKWKWQLDYGYLWDDFFSSLQGGNNWMFQQLAGFFNQVEGQYASWLYMDPFDNLAKITNSPGVSGQSYVLWNYNAIWNLTPNGSLTTGQLCKQQIGGPYEACQWVVTGSSLKVYINGALQAGGYSISNGPPATITFSSAPAAGSAVTWSGQFYYLCRFSKDSYDFSHDWYGKYSAKKIEFQTVFA